MEIVEFIRLRKFKPNYIMLHANKGLWSCSRSVIDPLIKVLQAINYYISTISFMREIHGQGLVMQDAAGPPTDQYFNYIIPN